MVATPHHSAASTKGNGATAQDDAADPFLAALHAGTLTVEELVQGYCARVHGQCASYEEAGRRLGLNWRTVRDRVHAWTHRRRRPSR